MNASVPGKAMITCLLLTAMLACSHSKQPATVLNSWDRKAAATYLDDREGWWTQWISASRDHDTYCVSCHTVVPYALARPRLRAALAEQGPSANERGLIENVTKRVRLGKDTSPYYSEGGYDQDAVESRGTEAVLNALILANNARQRGQLSDDTRAAFAAMWVLQQSSGDNRGAWPWLQFDQEPWEAKDSTYYGACLAAIAAGIAPGGYASTPGIQNNLKLLRDYLNHEKSGQSTLNRAFLLWASTKLAGVLDPKGRDEIVKEILSRQQSDGGWRLASVAWSWNGWSAKSLIKMWFREDGTPLEGQSDSVATGFFVFALLEAGVSREDTRVQRGISWLMNNQAAEGYWPASSVNKRKHLSSYTGRFMSDAGTAFAVLALTENQQKGTSVVTASSR